ncbi:MAG: Gfo/Idh/MocA family protein, partial [Halobacteriaceae archaeon]
MHRSLLVGCGNRGSRHAGTLARREEFEFAAVCDIDRERAEAAAAEHGVPAVFTDLQAALAAVEPTHVSCVFPPSVRLSFYRPVLEYEPDSMVVEKPVANTRREAERFRELAADAATAVTVCHQHIYTAEAAALKRWLDGGRLGEPERVTATSRGYLLSNGSHLVHMVDWLLGATPDRVRGFAEGPELMDERDVAEPEGALLAADYPGTRAYVEAGEYAPPVPGEESRWLETRFDVIGTEGRAEVVLTDHATLVADGREHVDASAAASDWFGDGEWDRWDYLEGYATDELYAEHARTLDGGEHPAALGRAVAAQNTIEAGLRAAVEGRGIAPETAPPPGVPTERRLRAHLYSRRPHVVDAGAFADRPLGEALSALAGRGRHHVAVGADRADPAVLAEHRMTVPVVAVAADADVERAAGVAADLDAGLLVEGVGLPAEPPAWLASVAGVRVALDPGAPADGDDLADLASLAADTGVCLSPAAVLAAGGSPAGALSRLGGDVAVLSLADAP